MTDARHEFAERMRAKPIPASMTTDPDARFFDDPPERIQIAFGGRDWFHATDCRAVHRIGLLLGLGWQLGEFVRKQLGGPMADVNGVRITARTVYWGMTEQLFDLFFVHYYQDCEEGAEPDNLEPVKYHILGHCAGVPIDKLKLLYAQHLGGHAV